MHRLVLHTRGATEPRCSGSEHTGLVPATERQFADHHFVRDRGFRREQRVQLRVKAALMGNTRTRIDEHPLGDRFLPRCYVPFGWSGSFRKSGGLRRGGASAVGSDPARARSSADALEWT